MSEDINRMSPDSTNELLKKMRAITNDLWRESPDVAAETKEKTKKPEKVVVKSPEIGIDNLWMTADETIDWTDALGTSSSNARRRRFILRREYEALRKFFGKMEARHVINGDDFFDEMI